MLTLPNARVEVKIRSVPHALDCRAEDLGEGITTILDNWPDIEKRLEGRNWRELRRRLIELEFVDSSRARQEIATWLNDTGYTPVLEGFSSLSERHELSFKCEHVAPGIRVWLEKYKRVVSWLMSIEISTFRAVIALAWEHAEDLGGYLGIHVRCALDGSVLPKLKHPVEEFMKNCHAPEDLDPGTLSQCLIGAGVAANMRSLFRWNAQGEPVVIVHVESPIEAIVLSLHIDRNLNARPSIACKKCSKLFKQKKSSQHFCSSRCRNYLNTTQRRKNVRLLDKALKAWAALPLKDRNRHQLCEWVWVWMDNNGGDNPKIDRPWIERQLREREFNASLGVKTE